MLKLDIDLVVSALHAGNEYEKIKVALTASATPEEFLLICLESFKMNQNLVRDLEIGIIGPPVELEPSFVEDIRKIRDDKNGLKALVFSMKHFGVIKAEESMAKIFDITDLTRYKPLIVQFTKWSPQIATLKSKSEKPTKKTEPSIDFSQLKLKQELVLKPAVTSTNVEVTAMFEQKGNNTLLKRLMSSFNRDVPPTVPIVIQDGWSLKNKSTYGAFIRDNKKKNIIDVKKEDITRRVLIYTH